MKQTAKEIFIKHYELASGKKCDEMVLHHMRYAIDAMEQYASQSFPSEEAIKSKMNLLLPISVHEQDVFIDGFKAAINFIESYRKEDEHDKIKEFINNLKKWAIKIHNEGTSRKLRHIDHSDFYSKAELMEKIATDLKNLIQ